MFATVGVTPVTVVVAELALTEPDWTLTGSAWFATSMYAARPPLDFTLTVGDGVPKQVAPLRNVKVKFVAATSVAVAEMRKSSCARFVVESSRRIEVQLALGGQMNVPVPPLAVICATSRSPATRPAGFVMTSVVAPPVPAELTERLAIAGSIT